MAAPILANTLQIPGISEPFDVDGKPNYQWYRWMEIVQVINGSSNVSISGLQIEIQTAQTTANTADATANLGLVRANQGVAIANQAISGTVVNTSSIAIINTALSNFLIKNNNLSDLSNKTIARQNLLLNTIEFTQNFDTCPIGLTRYIGIGQACSIPINFGGSIATSGINTTNNSTFSIGYARGLPGTISITPIGSLTFINGGNFYNFVGNATSLIPRDFLTITSPMIPDPTLAQVGIMIQAVLS